ncbi:MAG: DUF433 domain-containing protein [Rubrobacteraceae bacterium]
MVNTLEYDYDLFTRPLYSYAEADRLAGVPRSTSNRWVKGYNYWNEFGERITRPPMAAGPGGKTEGGVSFFDLISIKAIDGLRKRGFGARKIRDVVRYCQDELGVDYPFVTLRFKTGRREVYMHAGDGRLLEILGGQQGAQAWDQILDPFLRDLDYHNDFAHRWWPLGKDELVMVDPEYGFGLPVIVGSGLRTELVSERRDAGDTPQVIAYDFNLSREQVESALRLEDQLAA